MRFQPKFGLRFLLVAVALVPLMIWGVYQYQTRKQRQEALERLQQIEQGNTTGNSLIKNHWTFRADGFLADVTLNSQHDPNKLLDDCRRAGVAIYKIELSSDCLVDIALAERIARVPGLQRLEVKPGCQVEAAAVPILVTSAPEICLEYGVFHQLEAVQPKRRLEQLTLHLVPADKFVEMLDSATVHRPLSLFVETTAEGPQPDSTPIETTDDRRETLRLAREANPDMLIYVDRELLESTYDWPDPVLESVYQQAIANETDWVEGKTLLERIVTLEPAAWPALRELVKNDFVNGRFAAPSVARAKQLNQTAPWCPDGYVTLGIAHYIQGEWSESIGPLQLGIQRAEFSFGDGEHNAWLSGRATLFLAAAHVATGHRSAAIAELERFLASRWRSDEEIICCTLIAVWIQSTAPQANTKDADACRLQLKVVKEVLEKHNKYGGAFVDQLHFSEAVLACLQRDFPRAKTEYDAVAKQIGDAVKPRFRAEFKRLGECIRQRRQFVTDYVPVVPVWD